MTAPPEFHAEIDIAASPDEVWAAVGDPTRMARWSPEGCVVRPLGPVRVGAHTLNLNRRGPVVWPTTSTIVRLEPGRAIAWRVPLSGTVWSLELHPGPAPGTTRLVHRREETAATRPLLARLFAPAIGGLAAHDVELAAGMHRTLAAIKADVER